MGLTVSSQEKSRLLFWSSMWNSNSPAQRDTEMSTEQRERENQWMAMYQQRKPPSEVSKCL